MAKRILTVCNWLLEQSLDLDVVKKLDRTDEEKVVADFGGFIGKSELIVPQGIIVYQVTAEIKNRDKLFFTAREGADTNPAYLSRVEPHGKAYYELGVKLLECPWYHRPESSRAFDNLLNRKRDIIHGLNLSRRLHPLSLARHYEEDKPDKQDRHSESDIPF